MKHTKVSGDAMLIDRHSLYQPNSGALCLEHGGVASRLCLTPGGRVLLCQDGARAWGLLADNPTLPEVSVTDPAADYADTAARRAGLAAPALDVRFEQAPTLAKPTSSFQAAPAALQGMGSVTDFDPKEPGLAWACSRHSVICLTGRLRGTIVARIIRIGRCSAVVRPLTLAARGVATILQFRALGKVGQGGCQASGRAYSPRTVTLVRASS